MDCYNSYGNVAIVEESAPSEVGPICDPICDTRLRPPTATHVCADRVRRRQASAPSALPCPPPPFVPRIQMAPRRQMVTASGILNPSFEIQSLTTGRTGTTSTTHVCDPRRHRQSLHRQGLHRQKSAPPESAPSEVGTARVCTVDRNLDRNLDKNLDRTHPRRRQESRQDPSSTATGPPGTPPGSPPILPESPPGPHQDSTPDLLGFIEDHLEALHEDWTSSYADLAQDPSGPPRTPL